MIERSMGSLLHSVGWFGASYGVAMLGYLGLMFASSRLVGADHFGMFLVVLTATGLIGQLGLAGVHRSGLREAATLGPEDTDQLGALRAGVRAVSLISLPVVSLVTGVVAWFIASGFETWPRLLLAGLVVALTYFNGEQKLLSNYLRGLGRVRSANLLEGRSGGALVAVAQAALVTTTWLVAPWSDLLGALLAVTLGFAVPVLIARIQLHRLWSHTAKPRHLWRHLRLVLGRDWKFVFTQSSSYANASMDLWIAALLLPNLATSHFGAAQRLAQLLLVPQTSLQIVFSPAIARMSKGKDKRLQSLLRTGSTVSTVVTGCVWLPMVVLPGLLLSLLFGADFRDSATVLVLLATGYLLNSVTGLSGITLSMSHQEGRVAAVQGLGLGIRIVLSGLAAWQFGVVGLAAASAFTSVLIYVLLWVEARRKVGVNTHATLHPRLRLLTKVGG